MKEFKGTPAPWSGKGVFRGVVLSGEGLSLSCGIASDESKANGRLALAAPELLEALQNMVEAYQHEASFDNPAILSARAAISKALGEE